LTKVSFKELKQLGMAFIAIFIVVKIVFWSEGFFIALRTVAGLFWMLVLPGYSMLLRWKLSFLERLIISIPVGAALVGILSYYTGLFGLDVRIHVYIFPPLLIIIGLFSLKKK